MNSPLPPLTRLLSLLILASLLTLPVTGADSKPGRPAIHDEKADGTKQIAEALVTAKKENKRVLLQFGATWTMPVFRFARVWPAK